MKRKNFNMIMALGPDMSLGYKNKIPWNLKQDLQHFKKVTLNNTVIMGRRTWDSLDHKPLPKRENIIISKTLSPLTEAIKGIQVFPSLNEALDNLQNKQTQIFLMGGKALYEEGAAHPACSDVYLTRVGVKFPADVYLNKNIFEDFNVVQTSKTQSENEVNFDFQRLIKKNQPNNESNLINNQHEEFQYLNMINDLISKGQEKTDRTGTGTISTFGNMMRFSLNNSFPLLTTKKVFFRGVVEELLWFLQGRTNGKILLDKNVKIWEGNGSREYLDRIGLKNREEHDLGPVYGFQWKHFGAKYVDMHTDYTGQGVDQISQVIEQLKNDQDSRRIILSAWNPADQSQMALPPCHILAQFHVVNGTLNCMMYQRSCDFGLGIPFNIASYSLLTCMLAQICNLERGEFIHVLGDTHIYKNHLNGLKEQVKRVPFPFPYLKINKAIQNIDQFQYEDFELKGYQHHEKIQMKMAV